MITRLSRIRLTTILKAEYITFRGASFWRGPKNWRQSQGRDRDRILILGAIFFSEARVLGARKFRGARVLGARKFRRLEFWALENSEARKRGRGWETSLLALS